MSDPWPELPSIFHSEEFGPIVEIHLPRDPVSLGAAGAKRRAIKQEIEQLTMQVPWVFTGDVSVTVEWTVHLKWRYGSDRAQDIDNIIKPLLDGMSGPAGCLIDDTQVNHVSVNWITWLREDRQHVKIRVESLDPDSYLPRGFAMVEMRPKVCLPIDGFDNDADARRLVMDILERQYDSHDELLEMGVAWETARAVLPTQRPFHTNKVSDFVRYTPDEYRLGAHASGAIETT